MKLKFSKNGVDNIEKRYATHFTPEQRETIPYSQIEIVDLRNGIEDKNIY